MSGSAWALSLALIGLGFTVLGVWSWVERLERSDSQASDVHRLIEEIRRHEET